MISPLLYIMTPWILPAPPRFCFVIAGLRTSPSQEHPAPINIGSLPSTYQTRLRPARYSPYQPPSPRRIPRYGAEGSKQTIGLITGHRGVNEEAQKN
ncbi:hypothetical protein PPACK8108_LOCUS14290 [Phakopsora pachyrhizi]|uniref:Uncharacterized protein n=1 Tax=Phakopsora pachyrhizi TaxID=170000 RepID=A0AAV0B5Z5_PHAPC|nr:hypothetical protein PPACK8108_LOCUS14290 [Phakopsora pachyrhizi]